VALANLRENPKLQPLMPTLSGFLRNLVGFTSENSHVVRRIPRIFNALLNNPHLHIGSEVVTTHNPLKYLYCWNLKKKKKKKKNKLKYIYFFNLKKKKKKKKKNFFTYSAGMFPSVDTRSYFESWRREIRRQHLPADL
jgi:hypothetical protein